MTRIWLLAVLATLAASASLADTPAPSLRKACRQDMQKYCHGVLPIGGRLVKCMKAHAEQLSDPCKEAWTARHRGGKSDQDQSADQPQ